MKRLPAIMIIGAVSTVAAACSSDTDHSDMGMSSATTTGSAATATPTSATGEKASFNDADVSFAQGMIPHHEQAVEMADLALNPAREAGAEVIDLATRVKAAQDPEIKQMTGWLEAWDQPMEMSEGDMGSMEGTMSEEDMAALAAASGTDFDRMWLEMMTAHHQGAVKMAETEQTAGMDPDAIDLAGQIIAAQQAEIEEMRGLLEG